MARKRLNAAKKRVLKAATNKNVNFVVQSLPELKQELLENSVLRTGNSTKGEKSIDMQPGPSGTHMVTIPSNNFDNYSDAEDIDMVEPSPQITRTYSRKKSIEQLLQEWETVPVATNCNTIDNSIRIVHVEPLYENGNQACGSSPDCRDSTVRFSLRWPLQDFWSGDPGNVSDEVRSSEQKRTLN